MDRIEAMSALLEVIKAGSFSAAARRLGIPPTSLTRKVSDLEAHLGARLLKRTTRSLGLTDAGRAYVAAACRIVEDVEEAERIVAGEYAEPRGELVLTAPTMFGRLHVLPIVAEFLAEHPKIDVRLILTDALVHLIDEGVDLAVRLGELADSGLVARRVGTMRTVVCGSPACLAAHGTPLTPRDVAALPTIAVGDIANQRHVWRFGARPHDAVDVPIVPRMSVTSNEAAAAAAALGVGLTRQRLYQVADSLASGALRLCLAGFEPRPDPVHVLQTSRQHLPLKARKFTEFAIPRLQERLAALDAGA